ncbi:MAG: glycine-rich domain-containing protein-like [Myxococcales bacterium]|nr:glycine-rich domain-containing protein-like [Myxococcales bacterium]
MKQDHNSINSDESFTRAVYALDLSSVLERLVRVDGWYKKSAEAAITQYRNCLILKKKYGEEHKLPPSYEVDEVWHAHVLHTEEYAHFCTHIFGRFLHHHPHLAKEARSKEELAKLFEKTQSLYYQEFGCYLETIPKRAYRQKILV